MGIFSKKYDYLKDRLRLEFNGTNYELYYGNKLLELNELNNRSKKYLLNNNKELLINKELLNKEINDLKIKKRYELLKQNGYIFSSTMMHLSNTIDGTMSNDLANYLEPLVNDQNIILGLSRIHGVNNAQIEDILLNGLIMNGHMGGAVKSDINLSDNVAYYPDNKSVINELMYAHDYKNSIGSILIKIPINELEKNLFYCGNDNLIRLNPKYILGYIPVNNRHIETIITNEDINKYMMEKINDNEQYIMGDTVSNYSKMNKVK